MSWIQTYSGKKFSFVDPQPEDVSIVDIANHLIKLCRYTGATRVFYSVAQHEIHVASLLDILKYDGLMHDSGEAYYGDITTPFKMLMEQYTGNAWDIITKQIDEVVANTLRFTYPTPPSVKAADKLAMATERRDLLLPSSFAWVIVLPEPHPTKIIPLSFDEVLAIFYEKYHLYGGH